MSRVDDLLHDTLGCGAAPVPHGEGWNGVTRRGDQLARRRHVWRAMVAGTLVIAAVVVGLVFVRSSDQKSGSIATNPTSTSAVIVASVNGGIVTLDPADGHVISRLVEDATDTTKGTASGVATTADGTTLYYAKPSAGGGGGCAASVIVERTIVTGAEQDLACGASPVVSPDGQWIAYTNTENGFDGDFLALTSLPTKQNYRPYSQLLSEEPSKVQPLAWSSDSQLLWNRFHSNGSSDQQTYRLNSPPLDAGDQPTLLRGSQPVSAAAYTAAGELVIASGTTDRWAIEVRNDDGTVASTRFEGTGPVPAALAAAPHTDALLLRMPDGQLLVQEGNGAPRKIAAGVESATWLEESPSTPDATTNTIPTPTSTTAGHSLDASFTRPIDSGDELPLVVEQIPERFANAFHYATDFPAGDRLPNTLVPGTHPLGVRPGSGPLVILSKEIDHQTGTPGDTLSVPRKGDASTGWSMSGSGPSHDGLNQTFWYANPADPKSATVLYSWSQVPPSAAYVTFQSSGLTAWQQPVQGNAVFPVPTRPVDATLFAYDANGQLVQEIALPKLYNGAMFLPPVAP